MVIYFSGPSSSSNTPSASSAPHSKRVSARMSNHGSPLVSLNANEATTSTASPGFTSGATPTKTTQHKPISREVIKIKVYFYLNLIKCFILLGVHKNKIWRQ